MKLKYQIPTFEILNEYAWNYTKKKKVWLLLLFKKFKKWVQLQILRNDSDKLLFIPTEDNFPSKWNNNKPWIKWTLKEYDIDVSAASSSLTERISCNQQ